MIVHIFEEAAVTAGHRCWKRRVEQDGARVATRQDGADDRMLLFDAGGTPDGEFNTQGNGWDKSADINVQIVARKR